MHEGLVEVVHHEELDQTGGDGNAVDEAEVALGVLGRVAVAELLLPVGRIERGGVRVLEPVARVADREVGLQRGGVVGVDASDLHGQSMRSSLRRNSASSSTGLNPICSLIATMC